MPWCCMVIANLIVHRIWSTAVVVFDRYQKNLYLITVNEQEGL